MRKKLMKIVVIIIGFGWLINTLTVIAQDTTNVSLAIATVKKKKTCKVFGNVLFHRFIRYNSEDIKFEDLLIPTPTIQFISQENGKVFSDMPRDGDFKIELPESRYSINVEVLHDRAFGFQRAEIDVRCKRIDDYKFNLNLYVQPIKDVDGKALQTYEVVTIKKDDGSKDKIIIGSSEKKADSSGVLYSWGILTFDSLTLFAERLRYDVKTHSFKASGHIWAEFDGNQRVCYETLRLVPAKKGWKIAGEAVLGDRKCRPDTED